MTKDGFGGGSAGQRVKRAQGGVEIEQEELVRKSTGQRFRGASQSRERLRDGLVLTQAGDHRSVTA